MAEDDDVFAEASTGGGDALVERIVGHQEVRVEVAAYALFDFGGAQGGGLLCADEGRRVRDGNELVHGFSLKFG
jgi:hypothetical protein